MARWKLTEKHYLYTDPPTEWEQVETDLSTGEQTRRKYEVPKFLNPEEPKHLNKDGELIVCLKGKGERGDTVIKPCSPTPAMAPLDEEAQNLSDAVTPGEHPIESMPINGDVNTNPMATMQAQINMLMLANAQLMQQVNQASAAVKADIAAAAAQQPKVLKPTTGPSVERRM